MLEFRELLGLATVTCSKKSLNCAKSKVTSFPLNILAKKTNFYDLFRFRETKRTNYYKEHTVYIPIKFPPSFNTCVVIFKAAKSNCACTYSSKSCRPVTSG